MSSRVRQDEPTGRSRQRQIAKVNDIPSLSLPLNFRLTFLSFVYFGKRPRWCRENHWGTSVPYSPFPPCATVGLCIESANVVGYQNKSLNSGFNYVANTFVPVGMERSEMTLGDIKPNDEFIASTIQFLTSGGATAKVTVEGLGTAKAIYSYWTEEDGPSDGAGWYLDADGDQEYNQNSRVINAGEAFCVERDLGETTASLTIPSAL